MAETNKGRGFIDAMKEGLGSFSQIISAIIFPPIAEGAEMIMKNIEDGIIRIEKRILRKISTLSIIMFGGVLLVFALFFFLKEFLGWSSAAAFFSIGITVFVIGLLLKVSNFDG